MDTIDKINLLLAEKGLTGAELSRSIGVSKGVYSQWNTKLTKPSKKNVARIAEFLGTTVAYLLSVDLGEKEEPPVPVSRDERSEDEIDAELIAALRRLTPEQVPIARAYIAGLIANRKD